MRLFARFARGTPRLSRLEAFSDGVFAVYLLTPLFFVTPPSRDPAGAG